MLDERVPGEGKDGVYVAVVGGELGMQVGEDLTGRWSSARPSLERPKSIGRVAQPRMVQEETDELAAGVAGDAGHGYAW